MTQVPDAVPTQPNFKRARLFLVLFSTSFSIWVIAMLLMYFLTVYPQRHQHTPPTVPPAESVR